jgi:hypothetical protein
MEITIIIKLLTHEYRLVNNDQKSLITFLCGYFTPLLRTK